jgi:hypothetical protein
MSLIAGVPDSIDPFNLLTPAVAGFSLISRCTHGAHAALQPIGQI